MKQKSYRDLIVWQKSIKLVIETYELTNRFPENERFGLISQMRRAAVSIPSNIAEASRRRGKDAKQLLLIAFGSGSELETQIEISRRLVETKALDYSKVDNLLEEVMKMLNKMVN